MSESTTSVDVKVDREATREIQITSIDAINLSPVYVPSAIGQGEDQTYTIILKGVQSVIDKIDPSTVHSLICLTPLGLDNVAMNFLSELKPSTSISAAM